MAYQSSVQNTPGPSTWFPVPNAKDVRIDYHSSQGPTAIDVSDTLRGIGDSFYALADSVSVL